MTNRFDEIVEQAKKMFKNHIATYKDYGENEIKVLRWGKQDSSCCYMNIIFHKNFIYISGDLREAVYDCTWQTSLKNSSKSNFSYLTGKLSCVKHGKYEWRSDWCLEDIEEWRKDILDDRYNDVDDKEWLDKFNDFHESLTDNTESKYQFIGHLQNSDLDEFDEFCESALWNAGQRINEDLIIYWVALEMAYEQVYGTNKSN